MQVCKTNVTIWLLVNKTRAYILQLLLHVRILVNQLGNLLLQSLILLHEKLVHCGQFSVHGLEPRRLLPLLITAPNTMKEWTQNSAKADKKNQHGYSTGPPNQEDKLRFGHLAICSE